MKKRELLIILGVFIFNTFVFSQKYGKTPEDSVNCIKNIMQYNEFYKQENYKDAVVYWRQVFINCPKVSENTFIKGINIVRYMYENEQDETRKDKLIDTLMMVYDQRIEYYGKEGYTLGRKGVDLIQLKPDTFEEVNKMLHKSIEIEGLGSASSVLYYYFQTTIDLVKTGKGDTALIIDVYDRVIDIIDYNIARNDKDIKSYKTVRANIEALFEPYATCGELINVYTKKFEKASDNLNLLKRITTIFYEKACTEGELFFKAVEGLHKLEPTPQTTYLMGKTYLSKKQYDKAVEYLLQAIGLLKEDNDKVKCYLLLSEAYRNLGKYPEARTYALEITKIQPNNGTPYIMIGDMYATTAKECGDNELTERVAYWAAVDKYIKAKSVDSLITGIADQRIAVYSNYFPDEETIFFHGLKKGDSYTVNCWINETTTVR